MSKIVQKFASDLDIKSKWNNIFTSQNPFENPFKSNFKELAFFYPTDFYHLSQKQYESILKTVKSIGEQSFIVSVTENNKTFFTDGDHWFCENPTYAGYKNLPIFLESAIYSTAGNWGLIISHEMHAIVSGNDAFMSALVKNYSMFDEDLNKLILNWKDNDNKWLNKVLPTVCNKIKK